MSLWVWPLLIITIHHILQGLVELKSLWEPDGSFLSFRFLQILQEFLTAFILKYFPVSSFLKNAQILFYEFDEIVNKQNR